MARNVTLTGISGNSYQYGIADVNGSWRPVPGNYVFAKLVTTGLLGETWRYLYIGETSNFADRIPCHERWDEARRLGATHVFAHVNHGGEVARKAEETDLIRLYSPPLNTQQRSPAARHGAAANTLLGLGLGAGRKTLLGG